MAGLVGGALLFPMVFLGLPAGALVDRWDRKRVMILSDLGRALAMGSIPLALAFGGLTTAHLALVAAVEGTLFTFFNLAEAACLPRVVPKEQLPAAVGQWQATDSVAGLVGPSLGGLLFGLGAALPFLADAVSYLASAVSLRAIRAGFGGERPLAPDGAGGGLWAEVREGLVWLWREPLVRFLALLTGGINLCGFGYSLILIVFAQRLGASSAVIGLIFASSGASSILGALAAAPLGRRLGFARLIVATNWVLALTWPLYYRLARIPDRLQGRVNSAFRLLSYGVQPASLALTGALLELTGVAATVLILFIPQLGLAVAATVNGHLRRARPFDDLARE